MWNDGEKRGPFLLAHGLPFRKAGGSYLFFQKGIRLETTEELNALLASIEKERGGVAKNSIYRMSCGSNYDGDIVFGNHVCGNYGSSGGDDVTTFTGTVKPMD